MRSNQNLFFLYHPGWHNAITRGSAIMRAFVPATHLRYKLGFNVYCGKKLSGVGELGVAPKVMPGDIVYFIKSTDHPDMTPKLRKSGAIIVFDPVDEFKELPNTDSFHLCIASSESHKIFLAKKYRIPLNRFIVIDHLHTNVKNLIAPQPLMGEKYVVGEVQPQPRVLEGFAKDLSEQIQSICDKNSAEYRKICSDRKRGVWCPNEGNEGLYENYAGMHIGLALFDPDSPDGHLRKIAKPTTKLGAFASYGIPTIFTYQDSYEPLIKKVPGLSRMMANNVEHACTIIDKLILDRMYYDECRNDIIKVGKLLHMDNAMHLYVDQVNQAMSGGKK